MDKLYQMNDFKERVNEFYDVLNNEFTNNIDEIQYDITATIYAMWKIFQDVTKTNITLVGFSNMMSWLVLKSF